MSANEEIIKLAVDGGWDKESFANPMDTGPANFARAMLDPPFWQALGKAMGWENTIYQKSYSRNEKSWLYYWHDFIDHLAEGKDAESFFAKLLTTKK